MNQNCTMNQKAPLPLSAFLGPQSGNDLSVGSLGAGGSAASGGLNNSTGGIGGSGDSSGSLCFSITPKHEKQRDNHSSSLCGCHKAPKSHCISATGVLLLVLLYTAMGSIIFVTLEAELEDTSSLETAVAASKPYPRTELANAEIRSRTVDRLWSITEDLNILYKENWTRLAAQEVQLFQDTLLRAVRQSKIYQPGVQVNAPAHKWTYASAFLYSLTSITTIGYGGVSPRTQFGRVAALVYALFGIPIVLLYLSAMGEALSAGMRCLFRHTRSKGTVRQGGIRSGDAGSASTINAGSNKAGGKNMSNAIKDNVITNSKQHYAHHHHNKMHQYGLPASVYQQITPSGTSANNGGGVASASGSGVFASRNLTTTTSAATMTTATPSATRVPISVCVMVLVCYVASGAIIFHKMQNWSVLESLYFCFTSLGTIGFGELAPTGNLTLYTASAYILVGMAVVAMCFSLIQTEIVMWLRKFSVQDHVMPKADDLALVSVAMTPKSS